VTPRRRLRLFALVVGIVFSTDGLVRAATEQRTIPLNLKRVEITQLIQQVGEATDRTILYDDQVRGTISIVAKRPVDLDEAWAILDASLSILGFSILPSTEGNLRIARIAEAVGEAPFTPVAEGTRDSFVTTLIPLRLASPQVVHDALNPLAGARVTLVPYERTNSLIASGPERAIARLTVIADDLDRVEEREIRHRVMRYREVGEVEGWIETLLENGTLSARSLEVWSDARTNSFIYRGTQDETARFLEILERIDRPLEASGKVRIYKVLNRDAEEVAEILRSLSGSGSSARRASGTVNGADRATTLLAESEYTIAVDAATRSLVVSAEPGAQDALREVLELIDRPPQLIAVESRSRPVTSSTR
jgi:type II secretory pathway component GspD/PulD (secretin)